jgi:hypothetical protein
MNIKRRFPFTGQRKLWLLVLVLVVAWGALLLIKSLQ